MLLHSTGIFLALEVRMWFVKSEAKKIVCQNIPNERLTKIQDIAGENDEIHWKENGKEFQYHREMYDIVRTSYKGDTIFYYCYADTKESKLLSDIDQQVDDYLKDHPTENKKGSDLLKKIMNLFFIKATIPEYPFFRKMINLDSSFIVFFPEGFSGITLPPPKYT